MSSPKLICRVDSEGLNLSLSRGPKKLTPSSILYGQVLSNLVYCRRKNVSCLATLRSKFGSKMDSGTAVSLGQISLAMFCIPLLTFAGLFYVVLPSKCVDLDDVNLERILKQ